MDRRFKKKMEQYFKKEKNKYLDQIESLDFDDWFDYWHIHPDWRFKGSRGGQMKIWIAKITYDLLKVVEDKARNKNCTFQVWATLCENTGDNAIYIHSKNPNGTPCPHTFDKVIWGEEEPPEAQGIINYVTHEVGRMNFYGEITYCVRKKI